MSKNIILLSDGTGNSSAKLFKTNVWRMFQALDLTDPASQVAYYDDGVGTSSFRPLAILGGVFGFGLKRNIIDIYSFCCRNYQSGDRLFGFGFSRGAFTIRMVAGFVARAGLIRYNGNDADLARDAEIAYRSYRQMRDFRSGADLLLTPLRALRDFVSQAIFRKPPFAELDWVAVEKFHFLGVWETVGAYGGPIDEITRAIDYFYWPLSMPDRFMSGKIGRACQALALDEERDSFQPILWDERYVRDGDGLYASDHRWEPAPADPAMRLADIDRERISQVWFVGVHADIGGGYSRDGLSYYTLAWMMQRAGVYGLSYLPIQRDWSLSLADCYDKLNDSRHGLGGYYRYRPRKLADIYSQPPYKLSLSEDLRHIVNLLGGRPDPEHEVKADLAPSQRYRPRPAPKIHQSVIDRIRIGTDGYSPIVLPENYDVVGHDGSIAANNVAAESDPASRAIRQETVWDWVWARRLTYFLTVFASLVLAIMPLIQAWRPPRGPTSPAEIVVPLIDLVAAFLPSFVKPWIDAFSNAPGRFLIWLLVVGLLMFCSGWMQGHIRDVMRIIWRRRAASVGPPDSPIYRLRTAGPYLAFFYLLKHWILPGIFALLIFVLLVATTVTLANRLLFAVFDLTGHVCLPGENPPRLVTGIAHSSFETRKLCAATGLAVQRRQSYRITLDVSDPWEDGHRFDLDQSDPARARGIETGPQGFGFEKMRPVMWLGLPLRRLLATNWFATVLRIGNTGFGELVLPFARKPTAGCNCPQPVSYTATFRAQRSGELFIYVNDSVIGIPGYFATFYRLNNTGSASVTLELLPDE